MVERASLWEAGMRLEDRLITVLRDAVLKHKRYIDLFMRAFIEVSLEIPEIRHVYEDNTCPFCGKGFERRHGLIMHLDGCRRNRCSMMFHDALSEAVERFMAIRSSIQKTKGYNKRLMQPGFIYICKICGYKAYDSYTAIIHTATHFPYKQMDKSS